jgi:hypothetical protein
MEQAECSETSAYKIQAPGNCPEENIKHVYKTFFCPHWKELDSTLLEAPSIDFKK